MMLDCAKENLQCKFVNLPGKVRTNVRLTLTSESGQMRAILRVSPLQPPTRGLCACKNTGATRKNTHVHRVHTDSNAEFTPTDYGLSAKPARSIAGTMRGFSSYNAIKLVCFRQRQKTTIQGSASKKLFTRNLPSLGSIARTPENSART